MVQNCVITDNKSLDGAPDGKGTAGGILVDWVVNYNQAFSLTVSNCVIRNNFTNGLYTSSYATNALTPSKMVITDCLIENNRGSGVALQGGNFSNTVRNCTFRGNVNNGGVGGGLYAARLLDIINCLFYNNSRLGSGTDYSGGGAMYISSCPTGHIVNCTIVSNYTYYGGGALCTHSSAQIVMLNTIIWDNRDDVYPAGNMQLYGSSVISNCLSTALSGSGNLTFPPPVFENRAGGDWRLKNYSAGVDAGLANPWITGTTDLAGQPRVSGNGLVDMGAYETTYATLNYYVAQNGQTPVSPYTNLTMAASNIQDAVSAVDTIYATNYPLTVWVGPGTYTVPPNPTVFAGTNIVYIDRPLILRSSSGNPADTILDGQGLYRGIAFLYSVAGKELVVDGLTISNCLGYTVGGGILMHDPVNGYSAPGWTGRVQNCVIVSNTVTYGGALGAYPAAGAYGGGIGVGTRSASKLVMTNCLVSGNFSTNGMEGVNVGGIGGGIYHGSYSGFATIDRCQIRDNRAYRGGNGQIGNGGALIQNSVISGGRVGTYGAQSFGGGFGIGVGTTFRNCLMTDNNSWGGRGSAIWCEVQGSNGIITVENCTLAGNLSGGSAIYIRSWAVAQNFSPSLHVVNSLIYSNSGCINLDALAPPDNYSSYASNCCLETTNTLLMYGTTNLLYYKGYSANNFTNNPRFVDYAARNYRLPSSSPCINSGMNLGWMNGTLDLDSNPRISPMQGGTVDIGAYEFPIQSGSIFSVR